MIQFDHLTKDYNGILAVNNLTTEIPTGEIFGLLGPNGSGKSTTILMLIGLIEPSAGSCRIDGIEVAKNPIKVKQHIGYMPEDVGFYQSLSAEENLTYFARLFRMEQREYRKRIPDLISLVGLDGVSKQVGGYSKGMRQRLGLANALLNDPSVIILDEPTANLDPQGVGDYRRIISGVAKEGKTVLVSSHILSEVSRVCTSIGLLSKGQMIAQGKWEDLSRQLMIQDTARVTLFVETRDPMPEFSHPDIISVSYADDRRSATLVAHSDISDAVIDVCSTSGVRLHGIRREGTSLEDLFFSYYQAAGVPQEMAESGLVAIAKKEFFDHLRRKFLVILGILLIVVIVGILNGVSDYHAKVQEYDSLQRTVPPSSEYYSMVPEQMKLPPSVLLIFYRMSTLFTVIGGILGIAMGFDLITKEKESRSLKILLAHPVYRDEVINGKALGGAAAIALALGIVLILSMATLLIIGIVPTGSEFLLILFFSAVTFLFIFTYFAIGLLMSTVCEESGKSLIYTLIVFMILGSLLPTVVSSPFVTDSIIGPMPEMPQVLTDQMMTWTDKANQTQDAAVVKNQNHDVWDNYDRQIREHGDRQVQLKDIQYLFSPDKNYEKITTVLTSPTNTRYSLYATTVEGPVQRIDDQGKDMSVFILYLPKITFDFSGILALIWGNVIALLVLPSVFFGFAYVRFMRMDIR